MSQVVPGPVEFANFIDETRPGGMYAEDFEGARELLASILQADELAELTRPYSDIVNANSLSEIIAREGAGAGAASGPFGGVGADGGSEWCAGARSHSRTERLGASQLLDRNQNSPVEFMFRMSRP